MRRWMRKPLFWMVSAEVGVLLVLFGVTLNVLSAAHRDALGPLVLPEVAAPQDTPLPDASPGDLMPSEPSTRGLLPGLNVDPAFWRDRLEGLNGAEAQLEALEWRIVHSALDTMQRYIDGVVVPSVERAEGAPA